MNDLHPVIQTWIALGVAAGSCLLLAAISIWPLPKKR